MSSSITGNFCIVPFIHLSTSPQGTLRPCCFSNHYKIHDQGPELNLGKDEFQEIWQSSSYQDLRQEFLLGNKPSACQKCFNEESIGKKSKRIKQNNKFLKDSTINDFTKINKLSPKFIDLRLGNICNLKCRSCNPFFSQSIEREWKSHQENTFLKEQYGDFSEVDNTWFSSNRFKENLEEILSSIEDIYLSGGEPLANQEFYDLLDHLIKTGRSKEISLRFNSNMMIFREEFFNKITQFKSVQISASIDAINSRAEYIRYPSRWELIEKNFRRCLSLPSHVEIIINCAVSVYNILTLDQLYEWVKGLESSYSRRIFIGLDIVHEPVFLSLNVLNDDLRNKAISKIEAISSNSMLCLMAGEKRELHSIHKFIRTMDNSRYLQLFKTHTQIIDQIRNQSIIEFLPEIQELLNE